MNYYSEIKKKLIDNEVYKKVKDYSKNKSDLETYYNVGKLLNDAGKHYGEGIIKEYSKRLTNELGRKYSIRYLFDMKKLYLFLKVHPVGAQLTMSHCKLLFPLNNNLEIDYYIEQVIKRNLSKRELEQLIKNKEYERLPDKTKVALNNHEDKKTSRLTRSFITLINISFFHFFINIIHYTEFFY